MGPFLKAQAHEHKGAGAMSTLEGLRSPVELGDDGEPRLVMLVAPHVVWPQNMQVNRDR